jgi:hypothetical protein
MLFDDKVHNWDSFCSKFWRSVSLVDLKQRDAESRSDGEASGESTKRESGR